MKYTEQPEVKRLFKLYRKNWKLFALAMAGCMALAVAFLLVKNPTYAITESVIIKEDTGAGGGVDMSSMASSMMRGFAYGDLLGLGGGEVDDEIIVLGSRNTVYSAVRDQQLNIQYTERPFLRKKHYFDDTPVRLTPERPEIADTLSSAILFKVKVNAEGQVKVKATSSIKHHKVTLARVEGTFPLEVRTVLGNFTLDGTKYLKPNRTTRLKIVYMDYPYTTEEYMKKFDVDFASKKSNVIYLSYSDVNKTRGKAFLRAVVDQYNQYSLREKNRDAEHTARFYTQQVGLIQQELAQEDVQMENFKRTHKLTDLTAETTVMLERSGEVKEKRMEAEQQLAIIRTTEEFLKNPDNKYAPIPLTLSVTNGDLTEVLSDYNTLLSERQTLLRSSKTDNPTIVRLDDRVETMQQSLLLTLKNMRKVTENALDEIYEEENGMMDKIVNVPVMEREYLTLKRQAEVTNMLYLYLLNQQAQNEIKLHSDAPKTQVVDDAYTSVRPVSPKPLLVVIAALVMALILPVLYLRGRRALKGGVDNAFELSQLLEDAPIYELHDSAPSDLHQPASDDYRNDLHNLRSEIDWSATTAGSAKVLAVAAMEREVGKSRVAYHLAASIARTQRRVLLIDADLRYSRWGATPLGHTDRERTLVSLLEQRRTPADASRLFTPDASLPHLQMLPATDGLQNPAPATDLLQSPQWSALLTWAKAQFDVVVLDTTALDQYPDALPLLTEADSDYFVFTAERSTKQAVGQLRTLIAAGQTRDVRLVLNLTHPEA
jgi:uncharacterized protein involved in exopolysaccharide biosynthesis/Mrp family chromosome partitioning ATPase